MIKTKTIEQVIAHVLSDQSRTHPPVGSSKAADICRHLGLSPDMKITDLSQALVLYEEDKDAKDLVGLLKMLEHDTVEGACKVILENKGWIVR